MPPARERPPAARGLGVERRTGAGGSPSCAAARTATRLSRAVSSSRSTASRRAWSPQVERASRTLGHRCSCAVPSRRATRPGGDAGGRDRDHPAPWPGRKRDPGQRHRQHREQRGQPDAPHDGLCRKVTSAAKTEGCSSAGRAAVSKTEAGGSSPSTRVAARAETAGPATSGPTCRRAAGRARAPAEHGLRCTGPAPWLQLRVDQEGVERVVDVAGLPPHRGDVVGVPDRRELRRGAAQVAELGVQLGARARTATAGQPSACRRPGRR